MNVPFVDLKAQYLSIKSEVEGAIASVFESGTFVGGSFVSAFEKSFSNFYQNQHCVGVGNGTDGLFLILKALGIGNGDEVITPAFSWISTSETISYVGATPVFADVSPVHYILNLNSIASKVSSKTKAVVVVHLFGQASPVQEIAAFCKAHNLFLIEDCSQAHFTLEADKLAGTFGVASAFSFYPTKNLGAYGDAGCVLTQDAALATKIRRLANHGGLTKDEHLMEGVNTRLDSLQAAVLSAKLAHVGRWTQKRVQHATLYGSLLKEVDELVLPEVRPGTRHTFHLFVVRTKKRNDLKSFLEKHGIATMVHYPNALPLEPAYGHLRYSAQDFPVAAALSQEVLSLPVYPELSDEQITYVCDKIKDFFSGKWK